MNCNTTGRRGIGASLDAADGPGASKPGRRTSATASPAQFSLLQNSFGDNQ